MSHDVVKAFLAAAAESKVFNEVFNVATSKANKALTLLTKIIGGGKISIPNRPGESS